MIKSKYSNILQQFLDYDTEKKVLTAEDGTVYNEHEQSVFKDCTDKDKKCLHGVKKIFNGVIV